MWPISCVRCIIDSTNKLTAKISAYLAARYITRVRTYALSRAAAIALFSVTARSVARERGRRQWSSLFVRFLYRRADGIKRSHSTRIQWAVACTIAYALHASLSRIFFFFFFSLFDRGLVCPRLEFVESGRRVAKIFFFAKVCIRNATMLFGKQKMLQLIYALNWKTREKSKPWEVIRVSLNKT